MRLTTRGRFAVTAMIDLAMHRATEPVTLAAISERQTISLSYLEQLFGKLRRCGLVASVRGPGGGYCLARDTRLVSIADILRAVEEPIDATHCRGKRNCHDDTKCITHDLWAQLNERMLDYLAAVTLSQFVADPRGKQRHVVQVRDLRKAVGRCESTASPRLMSRRLERGSTTR